MAWRRGIPGRGVGVRGLAALPDGRAVTSAESGGFLALDAWLGEGPAATTGAASGLTETTATVAGTVETAGLSGVSWRVEYGPTTAYGATTAAAPLAAGAIPVGGERER